ncbi:MAG TPA: septation protein A [Rhizomicrobium sp.]|nr:septation protein A [Rhizomicrobium sp.]
MSEMIKNKQSPVMKLVFDLGPLILFFAAFKFGGIFTATAVFMAATIAALAIGYAMTRKISPMPLVTAIIVLIFGGLTLYLQNDTFIKMKPTVLYAIFGAVLLGGLVFNRLFIKAVFGHAFDLDETGWRKLTWRWGLFSFALAILNEIMWRSFSTSVWVDFKVWGIFPLIILFALAQTPLVMKHQIEEKEPS